MGKADDDPSINPFDDGLWLALERVHRVLWQQGGDPQVIATDVSEALATDVPSMKRGHEFFTDRELLAFEYWHDNDLRWTGERLVSVRRPAHSLDRILTDEGAFYAWLPALVARWPELFGPLLSALSTETKPKKPARNAKPKRRRSLPLKKSPEKTPPEPQKEPTVVRHLTAKELAALVAQRLKQSGKIPADIEHGRHGAKAKFARLLRTKMKGRIRQSQLALASGGTSKTIWGTGGSGPSPPSTS